MAEAFILEGMLMQFHTAWQLIVQVVGYRQRTCGTAHMYPCDCYSHATFPVLCWLRCRDKTVNIVACLYVHG